MSEYPVPLSAPADFEPGDVRAYATRNRFGDTYWTTDIAHATMQLESHIDVTAWDDPDLRPQYDALMARLNDIATMKPGGEAVAWPEVNRWLECHMVSQKWLDDLPEWEGW